MSGHQVSPEAKAWLQHMEKSKSLSHIAATHHTFEAKRGGSAGGAAGTGGKLHVRVFADHAGTMAWMRKFDEFNKAKAQGIQIGDHKYGKDEFLNKLVFPVGGEVRKALTVIRKMNHDSLEECHEAPENIRDEVVAQVSASARRLSQASGALDQGHYELAYSACLGALNQAMEARGTLGQHNQKVIEDADHMVTALELTRDTGFTALALLNPANATLIAIAGAGVKFADDVAGGEDVGKAGYEALLGFVLGKLGDKVVGVLVKAWGPALHGWLDHALGGMIENAAKSPALKKALRAIETEEEAAVRQLITKIMAGEKLTPTQAAPVLQAMRQYFIKHRLIEEMLKNLVDQPKMIVETFGKTAFAEMTSGSNLPIAERAKHFLEKFAEEVKKESTKKSDLFWAAFSKVAATI